MEYKFMKCFMFHQVKKKKKKGAAVRRCGIYSTQKRDNVMWYLAELLFWQMPQEGKLLNRYTNI